MRVSGVRDFRNHAPRLLAGEEVVFVTRHGKLAGIVVPVKKPRALPLELRKDLLETLGRAVSVHLRNIGVSEKRVLRDFKAWQKGHRAHRSRRQRHPVGRNRQGRA